MKYCLDYNKFARYCKRLRWFFEFSFSPNQTAYRHPITLTLFRNGDLRPFAVFNFDTEGEDVTDKLIKELDKRAWMSKEEKNETESIVD